MPARDRADAAASVTWHADASGREPGVRGRIDLEQGEHVRFGISQATGAFGPHVLPHIGAFEVTDRRFAMSNFTTGITFVLENLEGGTELVKVRPRQLEVVSPFELSRVWIPYATGMFELTLFCPPPRLLEPDGACDGLEPPMVGLDRGSMYFAVLVALCEPRLRGSSMAAVPSVQEVVARLQPSDRFSKANRSSINYHIDYLVDQKLPVSQWVKYDHSGRKHSKRAALVAFALRFDLVTEEHLAILPRPSPPT